MIGEPLRLRPHRAGKAEVEDLGVAGRGEDHILGLEVAVDQAGRVGGREALGDLPPQADSKPRWAGPAGQQLGEGPPLDILEDHRIARRIEDDVVDLHQGRMGDARRCAGLAAESLPSLRIPGARTEPFDRHPPSQPVVPSKEHLPHSTLPQRALQPVGAEISRPVLARGGAFLIGHWKRVLARPILVPGMQWPSGSMLQPVSLHSLVSQLQSPPKKSGCTGTLASTARRCPVGGPARAAQGTARTATNRRRMTLRRREVLSMMAPGRALRRGPHGRAGASLDKSAPNDHSSCPAQRGERHGEEG